MPLLRLLPLLLLPSLALAGPARPLSEVREANAMDPRFSPDGTHISFEVVHAQEKYTDLLIVPTRGGPEEKVAPPASAGGLSGRFGARKQVNHELAWAPGGQLWAFSSSGSDNDFDIWLRGVTVPLGTEDKEGGATFSADGRSLAYCSAATGEGDLYLLDIYALENPPTRLTTSPGLDFYATFSPQGSALAYTAMTEQGANIHVIDDPSRPDATNRALTAWRSNQLKPSWSPDGRWIAFFSNHNRSSGFDLYVVAARGGEPRLVASNVVPNERRGPAWTPDSEAIVTVIDDPNSGDPLVLAKLDGTLRNLTTSTLNNAEPSVSPILADGSLRIAFVAQGGRGDDIQKWRRVWVVEVSLR